MCDGFILIPYAREFLLSNKMFKRWGEEEEVVQRRALKRLSREYRYFFLSPSIRVWNESGC